MTDDEVNIEKKIEGAAVKLTQQNDYSPHCAAATNMRIGFRAGAAFGRAIGRQEAIDALNLEVALADRRKYIMQDATKRTNEYWADWLKQKFRGTK